MPRAFPTLPSPARGQRLPPVMTAAMVGLIRRERALGTELPHAALAARSAACEGRHRGELYLCVRKRSFVARVGYSVARSQGGSPMKVILAIAAAWISATAIVSA